MTGEFGVAEPLSVLGDGGQVPDGAGAYVASVAPPIEAQEPAFTLASRIWQLLDVNATFPPRVDAAEPQEHAEHCRVSVKSVKTTCLSE